MNRLRPERLHTRLGAGADLDTPLSPRRYTLTHSDRTGDLYLTIGAEYDEGLGTMVSSTDPNGHETTYERDVFGRLTQILRPDDDPRLPSTEFSYVLGIDLDSATRHTRAGRSTTGVSPVDRGSAGRDSRRTGSADRGAKVRRVSRPPIRRGRCRRSSSSPRIWQGWTVCSA